MQLAFSNRGAFEMISKGFDQGRGYNTFLCPIQLSMNS